MTNQDALTQACYEAKFLEQQPPKFKLLWRQFALNIKVDTESQLFRVECHGSQDIVRVVEEIRSELIVPSRWGLLITL
jgi:hypothetical protein